MKSPNSSNRLQTIRGRGRSRHTSHAVVIRAAATLGRNPGDDLVRVRDVAGLAVDTIGGVQADALAMWLRCVFDQFIDVGGAKILAGAAIFFCAALVADVGVVNDQV